MSKQMTRSAVAVLSYKEVAALPPGTEVIIRSVKYVKNDGDGWNDPSGRTWTSGWMYAAS